VARASILAAGVILLVAGAAGALATVAWILVALPLLAELVGSIVYLRSR
jgi:hypothetical protein